MGDKRDTKLMETVEAALIERCRRGDAEAFGDIVRAYAGRATGAAMLLLGNHDDALDASQEAFVRAWRNIRRLKCNRAFYSWYCTILRNVCLDRLRRRARRKTVDLPDDHPDPAENTGPGTLAEKNEQTERVWNAVTMLPLNHREIIVMSHFQEMSYKEMAEALGIPIGTVMSRLYHARQRLREMLEKDRP